MRSAERNKGWVEFDLLRESLSEGLLVVDIQTLVTDWLSYASPLPQYRQIVPSGQMILRC